MNYIFYHKYNINDASPVLFHRQVLLVEPETEASAIYIRHLSLAKFDVTACGSFDQMPGHIIHSRPDLLIINPSSNLKTGVILLRHAKTLYPDLPVIYGCPDIT